MAHHKRKRSKRQVRCTLCTQHSWLGNCSDRWRVQYRSQTQEKLHDTR